LHESFPFLDNSDIPILRNSLNFCHNYVLER
jgi:hypothetical protein